MNTKHIYLSGILFILLLITFSCSDSDNSWHSGGSGQGVSMARFSIQGDYLYTVDHEKLKVFDISTAENPGYMAGKDQYIGWNIETVFTQDTLLFIGSSFGMYIYNITRPEFPQKMAEVNHITSCDPVVAYKNFAYVSINSEKNWCSRGGNAFMIYDISDIRTPVLLHTEDFGHLEHPRGLGVDRNKLFLCTSNTNNGLKIYDISNPATPVWMDDLTYIPEAKGLDAYDVIPSDGILLLTGKNGIYQFDYTGEKISFISHIPLSNQE